MTMRFRTADIRVINRRICVSSCHPLCRLSIEFGLCQRKIQPRLNLRLDRSPASENQFQRELQLARILRTGDVAEICRERSPVRNIEVRVIENIVSLGPELELDSFLKRDLFLQGKIELPQSRPDHGVPRRVPK